MGVLTLNIEGMTQETPPVKRCLSLTLEQSDALFFPGVGSKVSKARIFCGDCPLQNLCLKDAIKFDLEGFYAGTTKDERRAMKGFISDLTVSPIDVDEFLPQKSKRRVALRKVTPTPDPYYYLDELEPDDRGLAAAAVVAAELVSN